ncbi:hypothetical protein A2U01_0106638, partial [Trifolium medium]|nr:hypothetical protein [Trifolium medium]
GVFIVEGVGDLQVAIAGLVLVWVGSCYGGLHGFGRCWGVVVRWWWWLDLAPPMCG